MPAAELNAPIQAIVVALDVAGVGDGAVHDSERQDFARRLVAALGQSCTLQRVERAGEPPAIVAVLTPGQPMAPALQRILGFAHQYDEQHSHLRARVLIHHGVVFGAQGASSTSFVGSALRSAHSALRRLAKIKGAVGTQEFVDFAQRMPALGVHLQRIEGSIDPLWSVKGKTVAETPAAHEGVHVSDANLSDYLRARLAEDVGPFASALVDGARHSARSVSGLIEELAREIDSTEARSKFLKDVEEYLAGRRRH